MPVVMSKPSAAAYTSLVYITVGALTDVWSGIWYWYLSHHADTVHEFTWYWCYGFLLTGFVLLIIGLTVGQIGRSARHAELPPEDALHAAPRTQPPAPIASLSPLAPPGTAVAIARPLTPAAPAAVADNRPVAAPPAGRA